MSETPHLECWPMPLDVADAVAWAQGQKWDHLERGIIDLVETPFGIGIVCRSASPHIDDIHNPWSALFVLRNDGMTVATGRRARRVECQPKPGDALLLNIHAEHSCGRKDRNHRGDLFIAAFIDYAEKPTRARVEEDYRNRWREKKARAA